MKNQLFLFSVALSLLSSCQQPQSTTAKFSDFRYQGKDKDFTQNIDSANQYFNPIIAGFYPDPSVCRKDSDYYLVCSSFSYFPGIPLFHSRDLVNWNQIGHVLDRSSQLRLDSVRLSGGIYAPAISYNKNNSTFYVITTSVDGIGNFLVKSQDPASGWSDPYKLPELDGIDPSLFFDDDGKAYIVHCGVPEGKPEYEGHRAIRICEYNPQTDKIETTPKVIVDGGSNKKEKPIWIEGPHLYKVNGSYILIAAEGGTGENHSEVAFKSRSPYGPYVPYKKNPILTQRDVAGINHRFTSTGHADLIQTPADEWYAVFLGCRPYSHNYYNTGRETLLMPVRWSEGYPVINENRQIINTVNKKEGCHFKGTTTGNFLWNDDFRSDSLDMNWIFVRTPQKNWYKVGKGVVEITPSPRSIYDIVSPAFIGRRQQHICFGSQVDMSFTPAKENDIAGIACYQSEKSCYVFGKTIMHGDPVIALTGADSPLALAYSAIDKRYYDKPVTLRVEGNGKYYSFYYSFDQGRHWKLLDKADGTLLSTAKAGGFTGTVIGVYAYSE